MGSGLSNLHFRRTIYLDHLTGSGAIRRFEDKIETDERLAEIFQNTKSQFEIGKT